jgi:Ulp1 family protease
LHWYLAIICDPALVLRAPDPARAAVKKSAKDTKAPARKSKRVSGIPADEGEADEEKDKEDDGITVEPPALLTAAREPIGRSRSSSTSSGSSIEDRRKVKDLKQREVDEQGDFVMDQPQGPRERSEEVGPPLEDIEMEEAAKPDDAPFRIEDSEFMNALRPSEATSNHPSAATSVSMAIDTSTEGDNSEAEVAKTLGASPTQLYVLIFMDTPLTSLHSCSIVTFDSLGSYHRPVGRALKAYLANEARDKGQVAPDAEVSAEEARDAYVNVRLFLSS